MIDITIIIPVMNEAENLEKLLSALDGVTRKINLGFEYLFIEGGSADKTLELLKTAAASDEKIKIISLSRSFGKEASLLCGFDHARGRAVIPMDGDLQDPPELMEEFVKKWREGYKQVYGVRRNRGDGFFKKNLSRLFYKIFNLMAEQPIPFDAGDYRLLDKTVVDAVRQCRDRVLFMKGVYGWVGFKSCAVYYDRPARGAGKTSWNYWKLFNFALNGIFNSSTIPVRIWTYFGLFVAVCAAFYAAFILVKTLVFGIVVPGYASTLVFVLFFGALQLISLGVIGEYIGRIFTESKERPAYIVAEIIEKK